MLFPYTYVSHQMEKMQAFIDFIFYAVWCQAPAKGEYGLSLFKANPELHEVMSAFYYDDSKGAEFFSGHVERIYRLFSALSPCQIEQCRLWYRANNDIEEVCANDPATPVKRYADFPEDLKVVRDHLATFFKGLYSHLDIAALRAKIGNIDEHYHAFVSANSVGKCPFCGINDLLGGYHSTREAYDHYLPKALYPFNTVNFHNLVPACHHCNSSYKTSKDPAYSPKDPGAAVPRRAVFYPYTKKRYAIEVRVSLQHSDVAKLLPVDIELTFGPDALKEKIDTWKDVYGIDERYKAKLCGESDGKYWLMQVLDECQAYGKQPADILDMRTQLAQRSPYADCNFLRKSFLDACKHIGVL